MKEVVFDTNLVIDVEKKRKGYKDVLDLLKLEKQNKLKIHIPVIIASEKTINTNKITNFKQFREYMKNLGFKNTELLKPICYFGISFWNYCILAGDEIVKLAKEIHEVLFDNIEFDHSEYCKKRGGIEYSKGIQKKWKNAIIDTLILWSAIYYDKKILVTRDDNFHRHKKEIKELWGINIKNSHEILEEIKNES